MATNTPDPWRPGEPLRQYRERLEVGQAEFAKRCGISYRTLWSIEKCQHRPNRQTRTLILRALSLPVDRHRDWFGPLPGEA
jgi:DNA-binding XRE family transcriptional regulator